MGGLQAWHWVVLAVVVLLLFGAKRLPDAARSLGRSMRILKAETQGLRDDDVRGKAEAQTYRPSPAPQVMPSADDTPSPSPSPEPVSKPRDER